MRGSSKDLTPYRWAALAVAVALSSVSVVRAEDWPLWRYDSKRSANTSQALPATMYEQWTRDFGPSDAAWLDQPWLDLDPCYEPVVAGSRIFVPSNVTGAVYALSTSDGSLLWTFYTDGPVRVAPACWGSNVYFASDDGYLYCVAQATGDLVWKFRGGGHERRILGNRHLISQCPARGGPVISGSAIYWGAGIFSQEGAFIHALNCSDGSVVWSNTGGGSVWTNLPHDGAEGFAGVLPQGYFIAVPGQTRLVVPSGRSAPGGFDLSTGELDYFNIATNNKNTESWVVADDTYFYQLGRQYNLSDGAYVGNVSVSKIEIVANGTTYTGGSGSVSGGGFTGTIVGTAKSLIAADDKLFCVTDGGKLYCWSGTNVPSPPQYGPPSDPVVSPGEPWTSRVADMLASSGVDEGYCLVWGIGTGSLIEELYLQSNLRIIAVDPSAATVAAERGKWDNAGQLGRRVWVYEGDPSTYPFPPYIAHLIVSEDLAAAGSGQSFCEAVFRALRPFGGSAVLSGDSSADLTTWSTAAGHEHARIGYDATTDLTKMERYGRLPGTDDWTHQYGNAANNSKSDDLLARAPFGLLWFGGELRNTDILPRHGHGPPEQVCHGRLVIEGQNGLSCVEVYTGRLMWQRSFSSLGTFHRFTSHESGANSLNTNYCLAEDKVYVAYGQDCHVLDAETGVTLDTWRLPREPGDAEDPEWAHIRAWKNKLIVGYHPAIPNVGLPYYGFPGSYGSLNGGTDDYTASLRLAVLDRHTGVLNWKRNATCGFRHNAICVGEDKIFIIDRLAAGTISSLQSRGEPVVDNPRLYMLNISDGSTYWEPSTNVFGTFLCYSPEHRVLIQAGRNSRDMQSGEPTSPMIAYDVPGKSELWTNGAAYDGPAVLWHDLIMVQGTNNASGRRLSDGGVYTGINPLTGGSRNWGWARRYGCNTAIASEYTMTFRSGAAGVFDMKSDGGTGNLGGFKSSCTSNLVVANGVLSAPDYTRTCTCRYQNQASQAYIHVPGAESWTFQNYTVDPANDRMKRVGINFAAPGDRKADNGTLWLDYPSIGYTSPTVTVTTVPASPNCVRKHNSYVIGGTGHTWVAAQYATNLSSMTIDMNAGGSRDFLVRVTTAQVVNARGEMNSSVIENVVNTADTISLDFTSGPFQTTDYICGVEVIEQAVLDSMAQVSIAVTDGEATEGDPSDTGTLELTRTGGTISQPLTVQVAIGGTAEGSGSDFALTCPELNAGQFTVTFAPGSTVAYVVVESLLDADADDDTVTVRFDNGNGFDYEVTGDPEATIFCRDNGMPLIVNLPATDILPVSARLHGDLQSPGGPATAQVIVYWGTTDGNTTPGNWDFSEDLGQLYAGEFQRDLTGLALGTQYYYRCFVNNGTSTDWADSTETFTTLASALPPAVINTAASPVARGTATLRGEVTFTGGEDPSATIFWGASDGGTTPASWDNSVDLGLQAGAFTRDIWGLAADTTYYYRCRAANSAGTDWADSTASFTTLSTSFPVEVRISSGSDDAEEAGGTVNLTSTDLEITQDAANQWIGMRFPGMSLPPAATITSAYVQFTVDEATTGTSPNVTIWGQDADNPGTFTAALNDVSSRPRTSVSVNWSGIPGWGTVGASGVEQRTSDISSIVQMLVNRGGWASGNAIVILMDDELDTNAKRTAESLNGSAAGAPLLHVEYVGIFTPTVANAAASDVTTSGATLNGQVTDNGGEDPSVIAYWGTTDAGTSPLSWDNSVDLGVQSGAFGTGVTGLSPGTTYYYRCYATNGAGIDWADSTASFTTSGGGSPPPDPTLAVTDQTSGSATHTDAQPIDVDIGNDATAVQWIVSETHSTTPAVGDAAWTSTEPTTFTLSAGDGLKTVYVWVKEADNDVNAGPVTAQITLDTAAPAVGVTGVTDGTYYDADVTPVITITDANLDTQTITLDGAPYTSGTAVTSEGSHQLVATGTDLADNSDTITVNFTIDKTAPVVGDMADQPAAEGGSFAAISLDDWVADAVTADADMVWTFAGNTDLVVSIDAARVATITVPGADWNGSEIVTFTATDETGNQSSDDVTFTVTPVNDPPVVSAIPGQTVNSGEPFGQIALDDYVTDVDNTDAQITWSTSGEVDLSVAIDGANVATVSVVTPGWTGTETITFTATDPGAESSSTTVSFAVAAVPPEDGPFGGGCATGTGSEAVLVPLFAGLLGLAASRRKRR